MITPAMRIVKPTGFYVYIHMRGTSMEPFYVGKGSGSRGWHASPSNRGPRWTKTYRKHGAIIEICQDQMTEGDAFLLEMWLIAKLTHDGVRLVNISIGGEGSSTGVRSTETRNSISFSKGGRKVFCSNGMEFNTPSEAKHWLRSIGNEKAQGAGITQVCRGITVTYLGYSWSYDGIPYLAYTKRSDYMSKTRGSQVMSSDGMIYYSVGHAVRERKSLGLRASTNGIRTCLDDPNKSAYGLKWTTVSN